MPPQKQSYFTAVPAARESEPTARKRARRLLILAMVAAICGPVALLVAAFKPAGGEVATGAPIMYGRDIADATAYQAISGQPVLIPTTTTLSLQDIDSPTVTGDAANSSSTSSSSGSKTTSKSTSVVLRLPYPAASTTWIGMSKSSISGQNGTTYFEIHRYLVIPQSDKASGAAIIPGSPDSKTQKQQQSSGTQTSGNVSPDSLSNAGQPRLVPIQLNVPVWVDPNTGATRLAAAPSLAPWLQASLGKRGIGDYSNLSGTEVTASQQAQSQVGRWVKAYLEDDRSTLLALTGDTNKTHTYVGLGNFTIPEGDGQVQIKSAVSAPTLSGGLLLRVKVTAQDSSGQEANGKKPFQLVEEYDLLVANPTSAQPYIVAWGPAGSGGTLQPYSNAVAAR